jgi:hypothetical protein
VDTIMHLQQQKIQNKKKREVKIRRVGNRDNQHPTLIEDEERVEREGGKFLRPSAAQCLVHCTFSLSMIEITFMGKVFINSHLENMGQDGQHQCLVSSVSIHCWTLTY